MRRLHIGQKVREKSLLQSFPGEFPLLEERKALYDYQIFQQRD